MTQEEFRKNVLSGWKFKLFLWAKLPLAALAGIKVRYFDAERSETQVKLSYLTKNPFGSIYFAVLSMAAELSTGVLVYYHTQFREQKVSMLVTHLDSEYFKKARARIKFKSSVPKELLQAETSLNEDLKNGFTFVMISEAYDQEDTLVARFKFTWSLKNR